MSTQQAQTQAQAQVGTLGQEKGTKYLNPIRISVLKQVNAISPTGTSIQNVIEPSQVDRLETLLKGVENINLELSNFYKGSFSHNWIYDEDSENYHAPVEVFTQQWGPGGLGGVMQIPRNIYDSWKRYWRTKGWFGNYKIPEIPET